MRTIAGCLAIPRVVLILVWFFSEYLELAYAHNLIWLILGFVFMPTTALAYGLCVHYGLTAEEWWVAIPILAALFDLGLLGRVRQPKKEED